MQIEKMQIEFNKIETVRVLHAARDIKDVFDQITNRADKRN